MDRTLTQPAQLADQGLLSAAAAGELDPVVARFAMAITPTMAELIDPTDPADPIAQQFVPSGAELAADPRDVSDPIGDATHSPVPGIVHRYPDRVLLMPLKVCPVYCRFCFRRETVGGGVGDMLNETELQQALDYIRTHNEVWEVILSGGDPLILSPRRLSAVLETLESIEHVQVIRVHSRVPVVDPGRITQQLVTALSAKRKPVYVVVHTNHPRELTPAALSACDMLSSAGVPLLSQSVLLKGINDDAAVLEQLFRTLVAHRIKPYYLHHADRAPGTAHFRTTVAAGQALMSELRGKLSGLCLPEYVIDIPGGFGKSPAGPAWVDNRNSGAVITDYQGRSHHYPD